VRNYYNIGALKLICDKNEATLAAFREQYPEVETCMTLSDVMANKDIAGGCKPSLQSADPPQPAQETFFVHASAVVDKDTEIGIGTKIWHFSHILAGSKIDENCNIGKNVVIEPDVAIGNNCKIQNNVSVYKGVTLKDGVFCGPSMVFTNIYNSRAEIRKMDEVRPTLINAAQPWERTAQPFAEPPSGDRPLSGLAP
jgi:UDP-2-acetamido-3-amino-2,3-dideoxy-glucuronate N-acetyltransferase